MQMVLGWAMLISSMSVKDRIIVGPWSRLNTAFHLAGRISRSNRKAK
jgi:hypothetical protein